jgi:hypothetical protein
MMLRHRARTFIANCDKSAELAATGVQIPKRNGPTGSVIQSFGLFNGAAMV